MTGEHRIIAKGFEVINTTSDLNIQGLVTCYRQPCPPIDSAKSNVFVDQGVSTANTYKFGCIDMLQTAMPPLSTAEALLLDGTKQWKAKEGAYVVPTLSSDELPPGLNQVAPVLKLSASDPLYVTPPTNGISYAVGLPANGGQVPSAFSYTPASLEVLRPVQGGPAWFHNFNQAGAYFTGLSASTTLTLNAIYYIERFPTQQDSDLVVLARHSCREDCVARDLYSEIIREMPVGVPQRMNGMGDWFADAVSSAADFISPVLSAIPLPMAQMASKAIGTAGSIAKNIMGKKESPGLTYSASGANVSAEHKNKKKITEIIVKKKVVPKKK